MKKMNQAMKMLIVNEREEGSLEADIKTLGLYNYEMG